jgi:plastocyanin
MRLGQIVMIVCGLAAATACGSSSNPTTPTPTTAAVTIPQNARTLTTTAYNPNPVTVSAGTTVTWTNTDTAAPHTVSSDTNLFESGNMAQGTGTFSFKFDTKGTFPYHCSLHRGMVASVVVQ